MYTNEHTKSMKPHCILGSCSAQFLSIMGWERQEEEFSGERGSNSCSVMLKKQTKTWTDKKKATGGGAALTIGCWSKTLLSKSPCSQNSAATIRATCRQNRATNRTKRDDAGKSKARSGGSTAWARRVIFSTLQTTHGISPAQVRMSSSSYKYGTFLLISNRITQIAYFFPY